MEKKIGEKEPTNTSHKVPKTSEATEKDKSVLSSCRICLSSILDPARLVCGHRFCERCLDRYWKASEEPNFVVCPLCRNYAFKVGFIEKDEVESTWDFRKQFDPSTVDRCRHMSSCKDQSSSLCLQLSVLMPLVFFLVKYLKPVIVNILMMI